MVHPEQPPDCCALTHIKQEASQRSVSEEVNNINELTEVREIYIPAKSTNFVRQEHSVTTGERTSNGVFLLNYATRVVLSSIVNSSRIHPDFLNPLK